MKKIYLIGTIIGLSIITMFTSLSVFAIDVNSREYYVYSSRENGSMIDEYYIPYDTQYIYYEVIVSVDLAYNRYGINLEWYDNNGISLFSDDMEFYGPTFNEKHQLTFMFPLIYLAGTPDVAYINDIIEDKYLYTITSIEYHVEDGFTISFNNRDGNADSIPLTDGYQFTSDNYYIISQQLFYDTAYQQGFNVGYQQGFSDGLGESYQYDKGFSDGYQQGYDIGYNEALNIGQTMGYNEARNFYGYYDGTKWYDAKTWGEIQFSKGQTSETNYFAIMFTGFFSFITLLGGIELLPGLYIWHFVVFPLVFGIIFFIIGRSGGDNKGGKK